MCKAVLTTQECPLQQYSLIGDEVLLCVTTDLVSCQLFPQLFAVPGAAACGFTACSPGESPELATTRDPRRHLPEANK